ncbi:hypothetical protein H483_0103515 [Dietzia sp. UCD-THP]|nr:hypothetical protein H483_0103515 [Dietzia sp. UCD-THP]
MIGDHLAHQIGHRRRVGDVENGRPGAPASRGELLRHPPRGRRVDVRHHDMGTGRHQGAGQRGADPRAPAGDDRGSAGEPRDRAGTRTAAAARPHENAVVARPSTSG